MNRATSKKIIIISNSLGGKLVDMASQSDGRMLVYDQATDSYIHVDPPEDKSYQHIQSSPSRVWEVNHNLNKYPAVSITDALGNEYETDVRHLDMNTLILTFSEAFAGFAELN